MVTSDLGACEWFVWDLRRSGLIDRGQLDQIVGDFLRRNPRGEPSALADHLIASNVLTAFQSERILTGKSQGLVLGPYILVDAIGQGSMGQVYRAVSKTDNQPYAIKVLPRRSMWNVRLARRQVRSFSQFSHPAVVPFMDVGTSGGQHYLAWPLVDGETLETKITRDGKMTTAQAAQVGLQVGQGMAICHQNGVFHGLLKPSNIMLGRDGQVRILDFGIGSLLVENEGESLVDTMSTSNSLTSGLDCASPESIMEPTNRTPAGDQYSLGCMLYFCLTGRFPFPEGTAVEKMMAHQFKQPQSLREIDPSIPEGMVEVVERLMQKAPESRYSDADELVEALQPFAHETAMPRRTSFGSSPSIGRSQYDMGVGRSPYASKPEVKVRSNPALHIPPAPSPTASNPANRLPGRQPVVSDARQPGSSATIRTHSHPMVAPVGSQPVIHPGSNNGVHPGSNHPISVRDSQFQMTPGWVPEEPSKFSALGMFMAVGVAAVVALLVLFVGKNLNFNG